MGFREKNHLVKMFLTHCGGNSTGPGELPVQNRRGLGWHRGMSHSLLCHRSSSALSHTAGTDPLSPQSDTSLQLSSVPITQQEQFCTGTSSSRSQPCSGSLQETQQLHGGSAHSWLEHEPEPVTVPGSEPLPLLKPFHLTKYLHEMAIRLPGFNEN